MTRSAWRRRALVAAATAGVALVVGWLAVYGTAFDAQLLAPTMRSTQLVDRHGYPLRELLSDRQTRASWVTLSEVSAPMLLATIHAEDKRFWSHPGVDPLAILRSAWVNARRGRAVMGASTLTQQTVKLMLRGEPTRAGRGWRQKLGEAVLALRLERAQDKEAILTQYVNRAPYGNQLYGVSAASWMYFDKPPEHLTLAEAATLACIPRSPSALNPYKHPEALRRCQRRVLDQLHERGAVKADAWGRALEQPLTWAPRRGRMLAPHFTEEVSRRLAAAPGQRPQQVRTTLSLPLQRQVQGVVDASADRLTQAKASQVAALVLQTQTGQVLAWVGSRDYWDEQALGANDGVLARRQPGSALKPFVYGALMTQGALPSRVFMDWHVDLATEHGAYMPMNYDRRLHGPVSMRQALGSSLNIPAILAAQEVGVEPLLQTLQGFGLTSLDQPASRYGLGLALGNGEVRLLELASAYAGLGRLGRPSLAAVLMDEAVASPPAAGFSPEVSAILLDMLSDDEARVLGFGRHSVLSMPYRVAVKTGTSAGHRDSWAVAVTPEHTVAVWAGNFDGSPTRDASGAAAAAPVMRQILHILYPQAAQPMDVPWFEPPESLVRVEVCALSGHRAHARCPRRREWMTQAQAAALPQDTMYQQRWIDAQTGRALDPREAQSSAPGRARLIDALDVPATWVEWAHQAGVTLVHDPAHEAPALGSGHELTQARGDDAAASEAALSSPQILHPLPADEFILDPELPRDVQRVTLRGAWRASRGQRLTWFVDGRPLAQVEAPYTASWTLEPGVHQIGLGQHRPEAQVQITVHP